MADMFKQRSIQEELLDSPNVSTQLLLKNLRELDFLNRKTGGHAISLAGLKLLLKDKSRLYRIADLGCGSGDWLRYLALWARKNSFKVELTGIDKSRDAIHYLKRMSSNFPEIKGYEVDYRHYIADASVDVYHCGLFCHHLGNEELVELLEQMNRKASVGFIINDLQRSPMAYYGAKAFTALFRGSPLSRHDGPVSVLRGFKRKELELFLASAGINHHKIYKRPFFRFLVVAGNIPGTG